MAGENAIPVAENVDAPLTRSERVNLRISVAQTVLAVVGILMGSIALYAALSEADAVRKQQQASVWPHLQAGRYYYGKVDEERVEFQAKNSGIGPARVRYIDVTVDGEPMNDWFDVIKAVQGGARVGISNDSIGQSVISAGENVTMLSLDRQYSNIETVEAVRDAFDDNSIVVDICYCSVFDACWAYKSSDVTEPEAVTTCPEQSRATQF